MKNKADGLYALFLKRWQYEKIPKQWAVNNIDVIEKIADLDGLMYFFPEQTQKELIDGEDDYRHLCVTCGIE
jgi:hypothetical protein